jgi:L-asparagine transporter-like permease
MKTDLVYYIVIFTPFFWFLLFDQQKLADKAVFFRYIIISVLVLSLGVLHDYGNDTKSYIYFASQLLIVLLALHFVFRQIYLKIYKREPEISNRPDHKVDFLYTLIIGMCSIILPFLIDEFIIRKFL